ncbi:hypothetical protein QFC21_005332 [Naganishia friedmannii]|uniref:Uncharacterized protein n=1 Tax=Naganishia friedmannii TaxID=89922 RepID=A0ACC2VAN6_9TREE|nr:hypothetical protein QFC21_005332 [Naganishia friedmannii]
MKSQTTIANSLSRIIVSLLLTCPAFIGYSCDTRNAARAVALPGNSVDDYARSGLPSLRQGLGADAGNPRRSVFKRHVNGDGHSDGQEDKAENGRVMDMFDVDSMTNESEPEVRSETAEITDPPLRADTINVNDVPTHAHDNEHAHPGIDGTIPDPSSENMNSDHSHNSTAPAAAPPTHGGHLHHAASWVPLTQFNETDVLAKHGAIPLSFLYHDFVLTSAQTLEFRRTGISPYGNATMEMFSLQPEELVGWQHEQYAHGAGSREEDRVMGGDGRRHPGLMALHVIAFSLAYFAILPIVLALRAAKLTSLAYGIAKLVFGVLVFVGWIAGVSYKAATPDLYVGHKHNIAGNLLLLATLSIGAIDLLAMGRKLYRFAKSDDKTWKAFVDIIVHGKSGKGNAMAEYERVAWANQMEMNELDDTPVFLPPPESFIGNGTAADQHKRGNSIILTSGWANPYNTEDDEAHHHDQQHQQEEDSRNSSSSDASTLRDSPIFTNSPHEMKKHIKLPTRGISGSSSTSNFNTRRFRSHDFAQERPLADNAHLLAREISITKTKPATATMRQKLARASVYFMHFLSRGLVVWAYIVSIFGIVVYTGMGRWGYLPSLLAHLIKGSIFFWYGLLTFSRYLGAFAEYGWAWNARPAHKRASRLPSAEMIESFVIFFYGVTNTWMERFGAQPGDPYTIKQVQHISIAVMFWFGGLSGMGLESRVLRRLLGTSAVPAAAWKKGKVAVVEPKSYSFSFNPFPALVIGILGIAMSAHKQDYAFQVTIHALWGYCLAGFSLFRLLTYFFLWTSPPSDSVLPSRPPTESLAAFCLACGGVLFFLSDEEIAYAAMRHAYDDGFAFLCWTVALVCFIFTWILVIMAIKGWAVERRAREMALKEQALMES